MKIAVTSQNRRTISNHAGRCRRFWIYEVQEDRIQSKELLEIPKEESFHESSPHAPHALDTVDVLICGSMGNGLQRRLAARGIDARTTAETDPDRAVAAYMAGTLPPGAPHDHQHGHQHGHHVADLD
ncbi:MAG: NifB/NifX family molybdenum-iron cluster-binding protein [Gammaproteobacteria bacterium]